MATCNFYTGPVGSPKARCILESGHGGTCDDGIGTRAPCLAWFLPADPNTAMRDIGSSLHVQCNRHNMHGGVHARLPGTCGRAVQYQDAKGEYAYLPCMREPPHDEHGSCDHGANASLEHSPFDVATNKRWHLNPWFDGAAKEWVAHLQTLGPAVHIKNLSVDEARTLIDVLIRGCARLDGNRIQYDEQWKEEACDAIRAGRYIALLELLKGEGALDEATARLIAYRDNELQVMSKKELECANEILALRPRATQAEAEVARLTRQLQELESVHRDLQRSVMERNVGQTGSNGGGGGSGRGLRPVQAPPTRLSAPAPAETESEARARKMAAIAAYAMDPKR